MSLNKLEFRYLENVIYLVIPILLVVLLVMAYRKKERILDSINLKVMNRYKFIGTFLITVGILLIVFSLLGPQVFKGYREVEKEGLDIYILFDTSKSMLSEDIKPARIEQAKNIVDRILDSLAEDRVGLIPFSSDAYIQMPLTDDYQLARMFLNVIDTDMIAGGGTDIGAAINLAVSSFQRSAQGDKVVLIISDGEEHDSTSLDAVKAIEEENIIVFTIGIGTEKGGLIPVFNQQGIKESYKKDQRGEYVISRLQPDILKQLAEAGRGSYFQTTMAGQEIDSIIDKISSLEGRQYKIDRIRNFTQLYQYFLGTGLLLFFVGYLLIERRVKG